MYELMNLVFGVEDLGEFDVQDLSCKIRKALGAYSGISLMGSGR
jgi:hypothetical protein